MPDLEIHHERRSGQTLSTRNIYRGRIFTVDVDRVKLPHGPEIDLEVVRHPGSVVIIPVTARGRDHPGAAVPSRRRPLSLGVAGGQPRARRGSDGRRAPRVSRRNRPRPGHARAGRRALPHAGLLQRTRCSSIRCTDLRKPTTEAHQDEDEDLEPRTFTLDEIRAMLRTRRHRRHEDGGRTGIDGRLLVGGELWADCGVPDERTQSG